MVSKPAARSKMRRLFCTFALMVGLGAGCTAPPYDCQSPFFPDLWGVDAGPDMAVLQCQVAGRMGKCVDANTGYWYCAFTDDNCQATQLRWHTSADRSTASTIACQ